MTTTELAPAPKRNGAMAKYEPTSLDLRTFGEMCARSGFFKDSRDAAQAIVKIQAGAELGFPPVASMTGIYIVEGKVTLSANLIAAAIKRSGKYTYRVVQLDDEGCYLDFYEGGTKAGESNFTKADAVKAKLAGRQNWQNFPRNMFFARALSNGAKWYCPDVFGGPVYTPDELGAEVDGETGEVKNPQAPPVNRAPAPAMPKASDLIDDPDLGSDDDFHLLWNNVCEGKGLDIPTGRKLLAGWEAKGIERPTMIAKLRSLTPEQAAKINQRASGGGSPDVASTGPGAAVAPAPESETAPADSSEPDVPPLKEDPDAEAKEAYEQWYATTAELWQERDGKPEDFARRMAKVYKAHGPKVVAKPWLLSAEQRGTIVTAVKTRAGHFA